MNLCTLLIVLSLFIMLLLYSIQTSEVQKSRILEF